MADATLKFLLVGEDKNASKTLRGVGDAADHAGGKLDGLKVLGVAALAAAGAAVVEFGKASVDAYREADAAQRQLEDAFGRFPALSDAATAAQNAATAAGEGLADAQGKAAEAARKVEIEESKLEAMRSGKGKPSAAALMAAEDRLREAKVKLDEANAKVATSTATAAAAQAAAAAPVQVSIDQLRELNAAIQAKTGADADDLAASQATLAQYELTGKQIADLTPLLDDYAVKTGKSLPDAAEDLGKAMLGQGKALKGVGIDFQDAGSVAGNFDQVMAGLRSQVGGFAESEASTAEGSLRRLATEFGDVQESVGEQLLPALVQLGDVLLGMIGWVKENGAAIATTAAVVGVLTAGYAALALAQSVMMAGGIIAWIKNLTVVQGLLNLVMAANPIGIVVVAIAALVAGLIVAYNTSEEFRAVVDRAFRAVGEVGAWLWNNALAPAFRGIVGGFAWVMDGLAGMLEALGNVPGFEWARDAGAKLRGMASAARGAAEAIRDIPSRADAQISLNVGGMAALREAAQLTKTITGRSVATVGSNRTAALSYRASGGPVSAGSPYIVGEGGPELIIPDRAGRVISAPETRRILSSPSGSTSVGAALPVGRERPIEITTQLVVDGRVLAEAVRRHNRSI